MGIILVLQIIFLTFLGKAIRCVFWGLDPISWLFTIGIGTLTMLVNFLLKFIPLEKILPGSGKKGISKNELNKPSGAMLKRFHTT